MKCLVCGKVYEAAECPRCHFPDVQIMGNRQEELEKLKPTIDAYRQQFLSTVKVELMAYRWKDQDGQLVLDRTDRMLLGTANTLRQGEHWLTEQFARIADQKEISVTVCITAAEEKREVQVSLPNLLKQELQQIGAYVDGSWNLFLLLRNGTEAPTKSNPVPLFAA